MSIVKVRAALETALNGMSPAVITAWENNAFTPPASTVAYQKAFVLTAEPDNPEYGSSYFEQGIFQVTLLFPLQTGTAAAAARAELLRTTFKRGASFINSGVTVNITRTPEVSSGTVDGDRWAQPVKIRFSAFISS
jgi:hypothetical protein